MYKTGYMKTGYMKPLKGALKLTMLAEENSTSTGWRLPLGGGRDGRPRLIPLEVCEIMPSSPISSGSASSCDSSAAPGRGPLRAE